MNTTNKKSELERSVSIQAQQLLLWLTHIKPSGESEGEADIGQRPDALFDLKGKREIKNNNTVTKADMKNIKHFSKILAALVVLMVSTLSSMAQVGTLTNTGDQSVCIGSVEPYGVVDTSGSTYSWTITPSDGGTISGTTNLVDVTWTKVGTYVLSVLETNASGCAGEPTTMTITVTPLPVPLVSADAPCENGILHLTGGPDAMATYAWIGPNGYTSTVQNPVIPNVTLAMAGAYTLTITNATGCSATAAVDVTINALPLPVATTDTPCENGTLNLTGAPSGMASYAWTGPNGFTSNVQNPVIPNVTAAAAGTYILTITNSSGCSASSTVDVTINPLPLPVATTDTPCENGTLNLTGAPSGMASYAWTGPNGFTSNVQNPLILNVTVAAAGTYILTITNSSGCSASSTVDVTINPLPLPVATTDTPCENGTLNLTGAPSGMASYAWTGPNGFTSNVQNPLIPNVTAAAAGTYILTITNSSGCSASSTVDVTINPLPAPVANADTPCENGTLHLNATPGSMTSYSWVGPNGFTSSVQNPTISNVTLSAAGTYTLTITNADGCTATTTVVAVINSLPVIKLSGPSLICESTASNVYTTDSGMTNYTWNVSSGGSVTAGGTASDTTVTVTWHTAGAQQVKVNYTDMNGCSALSDKVYDVTVNPLPNTSPIYHK